MDTEVLIWILFIIFLVLSNITSYKMGHVRGLMQGITTFELFEVRRKLSDALYTEMWEGDPEHDGQFPGVPVEEE